MDIGLFDNYEEDGQLSMFGTGASAETPKPGLAQERSSGKEEKPDAEVRIKRCSCCGKLLFVREEQTEFRAECNSCGVRYLQRK